MNITTGTGLSVMRGPRPAMHTSMPSAGIVRWDGNVGCLEVYDGYSWQQLSTIAHIDLSSQVVDAINWVNEKRREEVTINELSLQYPAIADLAMQVKEKQEQLRAMTALIK